MALSIDGHATGIASPAAQTGSVTSGSITAANAGDIVVLASVAGVLAASGSNPSLSGNPTDTTGLGLSYNRRSQIQFTSTAGNFVGMEVWWAYAPSAFTAKTFTMPWTSGVGAHIDDISMSAFCVTGFQGTAYQTNPWDSASGFSANNTGAASAPSVAGVATSSGAGMLLAFAGNYPTAAGSAGTAPTGFGTWSAIDLATNTGGTNQSYMSTAQQVYSSSQSGTVTWPNSVTAWDVFVDALALGTAGAVAKTVSPPAPSPVLPFAFMRERASGLLEPVRELWKPQRPRLVFN